MFQFILIHLLTVLWYALTPKVYVLQRTLMYAEQCMLVLSTNLQCALARTVFDRLYSKAKAVENVDLVHCCDGIDTVRYVIPPVSEDSMSKFALHHTNRNQIGLIFFVTCAFRSICL